MKNFNLTHQELKTLRIEHKIAKKHSAKSAYRINAVILLGTGWTLQEVSNALLLKVILLLNRGYQTLDLQLLPAS